jgi:hypothetical protein
MPYPLQAGVDESSHPRAWLAARELLELPLPSEMTSAEAARAADILRPFGKPMAAPTHPKAEACFTTGN